MSPVLDRVNAVKHLVSAVNNRFLASAAWSAFFPRRRLTLVSEKGNSNEPSGHY